MLHKPYTEIKFLCMLGTHKISFNTRDLFLEESVAEPVWVIDWFDPSAMTTASPPSYG